ncbi:hypothetical protein HDU92_008201, partial [Lobulomyces angularis]
MQAMSKLLLRKEPSSREKNLTVILNGDLPLQSIDDLCIKLDEFDMRYLQLREEHLETESIIIFHEVFLDDTLDFWCDSKAF